MHVIKLRPNIHNIIYTVGIWKVPIRELASSFSVLLSQDLVKNLETLSALSLANKQMHLTLLCCLATEASPWFLYMKNQDAANLETCRVQHEGDAATMHF